MGKGRECETLKKKERKENAEEGRIKGKNEEEKPRLKTKKDAILTLFLFSFHKVFFKYQNITPCFNFVSQITIGIPVISAMAFIDIYSVFCFRALRGNRIVKLIFLL